MLTEQQATARAIQRIAKAERELKNAADDLREQMPTQARLADQLAPHIEQLRDRVEQEYCRAYQGA